jgi:isoleucyl-tRNA synthetase
MPGTGSTCSARNSSGSASSATGIIPTPPWSYFAEAQIARELMKFAANGTLYRGSKPVMWSVVEKTALAEAEVEYEDYTSDTVWVKFPVAGASAGAADARCEG